MKIIIVSCSKAGHLNRVVTVSTAQALVTLCQIQCLLLLSLLALLILLIRVRSDILENYVGKQTENYEKEQAMPVQNEGHQGRRNAQDT